VTSSLGLTVYAREILELNPVWRYRGATGSPLSGSEPRQAASSGVDPQLWCLLSNKSFSSVMNNALQAAAGLAMGSSAFSPQRWELTTMQASALAQGADEATISEADAQAWLVGRREPLSKAEPSPAVVLVLGAAFRGAAVARASTDEPLSGNVDDSIWLLGLPEISALKTASAKRETWAALLALRRRLA